MAEDSLSDREREFATRLADNPLDMFQGKTISWLEDFIRITVGTGNAGGSSGTGSTGLGRAYYVPGDLKVIMKDLTAQTGVYVYSDDSGDWLYLNGVAVSQTTYADLYAHVGANAFGADSGGNFLLPDSRSRALYFCGTHADTDLGDSDGITLASRRPKHQHTFTGASVSGTISSDSAGTPAGTIGISPNPHSHTVGVGNAGGATIIATPADNPQSTFNSGSVTLTATFTGSALAGHSHSLTGATADGTAGFGMALDAPPYLHIGSLVVRF